MSIKKSFIVSNIMKDEISVFILFDFGFDLSK